MTEMNLSSELFSQASTLMIVGMGFVFAFLGVLILVIKLFITPLAKKYPDKLPAQKKLKIATNHEDSAIVAAITVAISKYRHQHK